MNGTSRFFSVSHPMYRISFGFLLLSLGFLSAQEPPKRSGPEKVRAAKALQTVKAFNGEDGRLLAETVLIDVGLIDRLPREEEEHLTRICEILLTHMLPDKPAALASAAGQSLYSILKYNVPTANDYPALRAHRVIEREWTTKVLANKSIRELPVFQQYLVVKADR